MSHSSRNFTATPPHIVERHKPKESELNNSDGGDRGGTGDIK